MLRSVKITAILLAGLMFSGAALAQTKVAVFNPQAAMMSTEYAQTKVNAMKTSAEYSQLQSGAEAIRVDVQKMAEDAQKNAVTWSDEQKAEHQRKVNAKRTEYEATVRKLQALEAQVGQDIQQNLGPKAKTALDAIIKEQKLDLVLDANTAYHVSQGADITEEVVKRINAAR